MMSDMLMPQDADMLTGQVRALAEEEPNAVALFANVSSVLYERLGEINWAGFYFVTGERLTVGPFQGRPACIHIPRGKGVCGTAWEEGRTLAVDDVHLFPGHIACDSASRSEIVIPLRDLTGTVRAVMDIDSPKLSWFGPKEQLLLENVAAVLSELTEWP